MTAERAAEVIKLFLPIIASIVFLIAGFITDNLALVGVAAGGLGVPYLTTDLKH